MRITRTRTDLAVCAIGFGAFTWLLSGALVGISPVQAAENVEQDTEQTGDRPDASTGTDQPAGEPGTPTSVWDQFVPPPDTKFDWIQLTSGEWLKGELKVLYEFSLEFDSDNLGLLKFDWDDVKRIRTATPHSVRIENRVTGEEPFSVIGVLNLTDGTLYVVTDELTREFDRDQIVAIANSAASELDLWTGKLSLGVSIRGGNSSLRDTNLMANAKRRTAGSRLVANYLGNVSEADGEQTSNNHRLDAHHDIFQTSRFFWRTVVAEYFRDTFKNIDHQVTAGTAFGYNLIRTSKTEWEVSGGVGGLYKRFVSVGAGEDLEQTSPALGLGTAYDTDLTGWMHYIFDFSFQVVDQESGRYLHHLITTLETDLISDFDLDVSFVWDRVQDPQAEADGTVPQRDDYQVIVGIGYEF